MILKKDILIGIFVERYLMGRIVAEDLDPETVKVSEEMTTSIPLTPPETPVLEAANLMSQNCIRHLPVLQDGKLYGVVLEIYLRGNCVRKNLLSTNWRITFLKPNIQISYLTFSIHDLFVVRESYQ